MTRTMIIPAAGRGSRLGTTLPKVLVPVNGRPMIDYILDLYAPFMSHFVVVVAPSFAGSARDHLRGRSESIELALQHTPTGMLDAILAPRSMVAAHSPDEVWVSWCDQVAVKRATVERMTLALGNDPRPAFVFPTVTRDAPYIHYERDASGTITRVLQRREGDTMPEIGEGDIGLFAMTGHAYANSLAEFGAIASPGTATKERNFLPFIAWLAERNAVSTVCATDSIESIGINTPEELLLVGRHLEEVAS